MVEIFLVNDDALDDLLDVSYGGSRYDMSFLHCDWMLLCSHTGYVKFSMVIQYLITFSIITS